LDREVLAMVEQDSIANSKGTDSGLQFLRVRYLQVIALPVLVLILEAALWAWTNTKIDDDRALVEKKGLQLATDLCNDYAKVLPDIIDQVNQITLQVKYAWEHTRGKPSLEAMSRSGIFQAPYLRNVLVIDRNGKPLTSSLVNHPAASGGDREYFQFHKNDDSDRLQIGRPVLGRMAGKPMIPFTRRLNTARGEFDGIVLVAVDPSYLASFYAGSFPGKAGLMAVVGLDGSLRSAKIGAAAEAQMSGALSVIPVFATTDGVQRMEGEPWFGDRHARYVAWKTLRDFPLVAMLGISEEEYLAPHVGSTAETTREAIAAGLALLLFGLVATAISIQLARKQHQDELVRMAYRVATEGANEAFYLVDALSGAHGAIVDFMLADCNERAAEFYGMARAQLIGMRLSALHPPAYFQALLHDFRQAMDSGFHEDETRTPPDSRLTVEWVRRRLVRSGNALAVTELDTTERTQAKERVEFLAHHDSLTGLPNRVLLRDRTEQATSIAAREKTGVALMFLDLDNFKQVNDSFGHQVGDQLLIEVVRRLHACIRDVDTVCRMGGDEFVIVITNIKDINDLSRIAQNMLTTVAEPIVIDSQLFHTSVSIGISVFPDDGNDFDTLLKHADTAMYQAKDSGRNVYRFFTARMNVDTLAQMRMHNQLRNALEREEFALHYQPQIDLASGAIIGVEALIRWHHPQDGVISPAKFIPAAEASGLIIPIGEWVVQEACKQARIWLAGGHTGLRVAVNLSALQFKRGNILESVQKALEISNLPHSLLELELTESILLQDKDIAMKTLQSFKAMGVQLAIDDFGTGYSSLSYLKRLRVDSLKIDQSFVRDIVTDADDLAITQAIIMMGKTMKLKVVAEGVETAEQAQTLSENGCHQAQGYYFCPPLSAADFTRWLSKTAADQ
jgi:diguanylate cyclase (GGDEF)-like protein